MRLIEKATIEDAYCLAELYAKGFKETGFPEFATPEKHLELVEWLREQCSEGRIWFRCDEDGPVSLGHYVADKGEVMLIVTRDGAEGAGNATAILRHLLVHFPFAKVRPTTKGGEAVAEKCGFSPSAEDQGLWVRCKIE